MAEAPNMWDAGDYPELAQRLAPAAAGIAVGAGVGRGRFAVDLAAGTGSVARRLAAAGWQTSATDLSSRMVELGRSASAADGHDISWSQADLAHQPFGDASQDLAASSFGLMFAAEPEAAVSEVARVLTPAGRLLFTTWAEAGYMVEMTQVMLSFLDLPPEAPDPGQWGSEAFVRDLLSPRFLDIEVERRSLPWSFASAREGREWLERVSPAHIAAMAAAGDAAPAMMDAVESHLAQFADAAGGVITGADYLLVQARRIP